MKNFAIVIAAMFALLFVSCDEDDIPIPLPPPPPSAPVAHAADTLPAVPELAEAKPTASAPTVAVPTNAAPIAVAPPAAAPPTVVAPTSPPPPPQVKAAPESKPSSIRLNFDSHVEQPARGNYVIQIGVFPSETRAKTLVSKLGENGINAYSARVNNPAKLLGTYHRVRIGFFDSKSAASDFAQSKISPLGYEWWVDRSKNDKVGNNQASAVVEAPPAESKPAVKRQRVKAERKPRKVEEPEEFDDYDDEY